MKRILLVAIFLVSFANTANAVNTDPVLRTYDLNNGAEVSLVASKRGTLFLVIEGKVMAELAPDSMTEMLDKIEFEYNDKIEFEYSDKIEFEYSDKIEFEYNDKIEFEYNEKD